MGGGGGGVNLIRNPTSRKFTYRGRVWNQLTAINEGLLYYNSLSTRPICFLCNNAEISHHFDYLNFKISTRNFL